MLQYGTVVKIFVFFCFVVLGIIVGSLLRNIELLEATVTVIWHNLNRALSSLSFVLVIKLGLKALTRTTE